MAWNRLGKCLMIASMMVAGGSSAWSAREKSKPEGDGGGTLTDLSTDARELATAFNEAAGKVRMVLILSPT